MSPADFSPAKRRQLYDCVTLQVMRDVEDALRSPPSSPLAIQRVYRLPHMLIAAGEDLAHRYTAACDATAAAFPDRPVPDPWGAEAEGEMVADVARIMKPRRVRQASAAQREALAKGRAARKALDRNAPGHPGRQSKAGAGNRASKTQPRK